ncbi:hypothetical protein A5906_12690 [Bradyrhizobium sacchari]|uniref:Aminotransferase class V n=1 Tax=Bradyrhizobium sacchari TaxID=1399419 RepID=A0A560JED6_9BRAD|nr:hypothetical protein A5906_12690 [Bradyrhizobium sacchari]TWB51339.1 aminotransferase class V [Bradyrhizobium sacchari]TWB69573.1 aminotransferase class V [Bradyrhizobium sacchari]
MLVDGSQGYVLTADVCDIDCDFYVMTGHKLFGPTGIGVLCGKSAHLASIPPFDGGVDMIREVSRSGAIHGNPPHRFEAGTPPIVEAIALGADIDCIDSIGERQIRRQ